MLSLDQLKTLRTTSHDAKARVDEELRHRIKLIYPRANNDRLSITDIFFLLSPNTKDTDIYKETAISKKMFSAKSRGLNNVVYFLTEAGAGPLHIYFPSCVKLDNMDLVRFFLRSGVTSGLGVVRLLLHAGADVHAIDDEALRVIAENGHHEVAALLNS